MPAGRPSTYSDEVHQKVMQYVDDCVLHNDIPYVEQIAFLVGVSRETFNVWQTEHPELADTVKRLLTLQSFLLLKGSVTNKYNPASAIFQLKANHGMIETEKKHIEGDLTFKIVE